MARSPIPDMIERFGNMTPEEQSCFLDLVDPQPEPERPNEKPLKSRKGQCAACDYPKAASIHRDSKLVGYHVYQPTAQKRGLPTAEGGSCTANIPGTDDTCSKPAENLVHDPNGGYAGYHEFEGTKSVASVTKRSSRKGAALELKTDANAEIISAVGSSGD